MDPTNEVVMASLRDIWKQMAAMKRGLLKRFDQNDARLEHLTAILNSFIEQTTNNFGRVQRNFERIDERFERIDERERVRDVDARLMRLEVHAGLRDD